MTALLLFLSISAFGAETPAADAPHPNSRVGAGLKVIKNGFSYGTLLGGGYTHFESDHFSIGGVAYTGQLSTGAVGNFSYGGMLIAYHSSLESTANFEANITVGGGGGASDHGTGGGVILEPTLGMNFILGKRVRAAITAGYLWIPSSTDFSGVTGGLRVDFLN